MKCVTSLRRAAIATVALLMFFGPMTAFAQSPVKMIKLQGAIDPTSDGPVRFVFAGIASHLGEFTGYGEVAFVPGEEEGTLVGDGVVVFKAANGDLLVGVVTWEMGPMVDGQGPSRLHFSWRDSVEFSNGTVVANTGRFVESRPPGLVVIILVSLLSFIYPF